jgi:hypothetical protein
VLLKVGKLKESATWRHVTLGNSDKKSATRICYFKCWEDMEHVLQHSLQ